MTKTGTSYKSIKITVKENEYSVPLPSDVAIVKFEYKKASDMILNSEEENEILKKINCILMPLYKKWNKHYKKIYDETLSRKGKDDEEQKGEEEDKEQVVEEEEKEEKFPRVARLFTYYDINDVVMSNLLMRFNTELLSSFEYADIQWSSHVMIDKLDKPLKVFLVKFKKRETKTK
jgi:hypothetical protein